jgi:hypothetical protein
MFGLAAPVPARSACGRSRGQPHRRGRDRDRHQHRRPVKLCRVRVQFPSPVDDQDDAWWATMVSPGAGKDRGWFTLPEVGDEVLCAFEHGEIAPPGDHGRAVERQGQALRQQRRRQERAPRRCKSKSGSRLMFDDEQARSSRSPTAARHRLDRAVRREGVTFTAASRRLRQPAVPRPTSSICAGEIEIKGTTVDLIRQGHRRRRQRAGASGHHQGQPGGAQGLDDRHQPGGVPKAAKCDGKVSGDGPRSGGRRWTAAAAGATAAAAAATAATAGAATAAMAAATAAAAAPAVATAAAAAAVATAAIQAPTPRRGNTPVEERPPLDRPRRSRSPS